MSDPHSLPDAARIRAALPSLTDVRVFAEIDSTNTEARRVCRDETVRSPVLLIADSQTSGRGRQGKSFYSPAGTGLYMTLLLPARDAPADTVPVTTMTGTAVAEALEAVSKRQFGIKWVNDIFAGGKKLAGILCEQTADPHTPGQTDLIIGIGINLTTEVFPAELRGIAASAGDPGIDRSLLAADIASRILALASDLHDRSYMESYRRHSIVLGKTVTYRSGGEIRTAEAVSIDDDAALHVRRPDGIEEVLNSGEISIRLAQ